MNSHMEAHNVKTPNYWLLTVMIIAAVALSPLGAFAPSAGSPLLKLIVQADDTATAAAAVRAVGGEVTHELGIINAVGARLTPRQMAHLGATQSVRLYENRNVHIAQSGVVVTLRDE